MYLDQRALQVLAKAFISQEGVDVLGDIILRLARFLGGDPAGPISVTSTGVANTQILPDLPGVQSAVVQVSGNGINYRTDGGDPGVGGGVFVPVNSYITLTGVPTIKGFRFVSAVAGNATLNGTYYD